MSFVDQLKEKLLKTHFVPKIVYAEGWSGEIQKTADAIAQSKIAKPVLIFRTQNEVPKNFKHEHIIIETQDLSEYSEFLYNLRKDKGLSIDQAKELVKQPNYLASILVKMQKVDCEICGIEYTTKDTLKPALQIIKTKPGYRLVTSAFVLEKGEERYVMGDSAINLYPNAEELAQIAKMISFFARDVISCKNLKVALLSYSTAGSGVGESVDKVRKAYQILRQDIELNDFQIFGEIQFDAAFCHEVMVKKVPELDWETNAKIYIYPNIDAGNIGYKIAQRMGKFEAIGPILIGLDRPVNDLSRGAVASDVIKLSYITAYQAYVRMLEDKNAKE